jgi:hypothetical protein
MRALVQVHSENGWREYYATKTKRNPVKGFTKHNKIEEAH